MYEDLVAKLNEAIPVQKQTLIYGSVLCAFYEKKESRLYDKPHIVLDWPNNETTLSVVKTLSDFIKTIFPDFECKIYDDTQFCSLYVTHIEEKGYDLTPLTSEKIVATKATLIEILPKNPTEEERCFANLKQLVPMQIYEESNKLYDIRLDPETNNVTFRWDKIVSGQLWLARLQLFLTQLDKECCNFSEADNSWQLKVSLTEGLKSILCSDQWQENVRQFHADIGQIWDIKQDVEHELADKMVGENEKPKLSELKSLQGIPLQIDS